MRWWRNRKRDPEIAPDEIFLDSLNPSDFDTGRLEGRLERPLGRPTFAFLGSVLGLIFVALVLQAGNLQIVQGDAYAAQSTRNSLDRETLFARRGIIEDMHGVPLVENETTPEGLERRVYKTPGFSHVVGYVSYPKKDAQGHYYDTTLSGVAGIEGVFDAQLSGINGTLLVEKDALGTVRSQGVVIPPRSGANIRLTIDARAQEAFYTSIRDLAERIPFAGGAGILMEIKTGAVRALVSYPEFDSNVLSNGSPSATIARYASDPRTLYLNRAVTGLYAPGSIVKPLEAAAALTDGIISPNYSINVTGTISVPNPYDPDKPTIFRDWRAHGVVAMREAIAVSSDVYFYMLGGGYGGQKGLGIERLAEWFRLFGLTSKTGIELPHEGEGFVPTPAWKEEVLGEAWRIGDTYHTAIGQYAMQVTPIAMARATAALANGGRLVRPTLIEGAPVKEELVPLTPTSLKVTEEGMRLAVIKGTATALAALDSYALMAGKTGTAQTGVRNEYYNSWSLGFFPYDDPKYVFVVMLDKGPAGNTTGSVAATLEALKKLHESAPEYFE
jgi:penicillin-binding protein 2